jgi:hypothetical protein
MRANEWFQANHGDITLHNLSPYYDSIEQERPRQVGVTPYKISLESCRAMSEHAEKMTIPNQRRQEMILAQKHPTSDQRMRKQSVEAIGWHDDDGSMHGDGRQTQVSEGAEGKKRKAVRENPPLYNMTF